MTDMTNSILSGLVLVHLIALSGIDVHQLAM